LYLHGWGSKGYNFINKKINIIEMNRKHFQKFSMLALMAFIFSATLFSRILFADPPAGEVHLTQVGGVGTISLIGPSPATITASAYDTAYPQSQLGTYTLGITPPSGFVVETVKNASSVTLVSPYSQALVDHGSIIYTVTYGVDHGAHVGTTLGISNQPPAFTAGPSDGGSSAATPTNVGSNVTFTATASDPNGDNYYVAICKTAAITPHNGSAPTCDGGSWGSVGGSTVSGSPITPITYTTLASDPESNVWYAYACDGNGISDNCSAYAQGSGATGSPFYVNHAPSLGTVAIGPTCGSTASIDPGNMRNSKTTVSFSQNSMASAIAIQSDGKTLMAGFVTVGGNYDFGLTRTNADGSLDAGFGTGGKVTTAFAGSSYSLPYKVATQADGKIVVAGSTLNGSDWLFALARYSSDGSLDAGFGTGGKVTTAFNGNPSFGEAMAIQPDGKIVAAGSVSSSGNNDFALARYNTDGSLDAGFGMSGKVTTPIGSGDDLAYSVALQNDGKIVVAGYSSNGSNNDFALARYNTDGSLDGGFGTGGKVTTSIGSGNDDSNAMAIQSDGKIVLAGQSDNGGNNDFALARYNTDGSLDAGFGTGGKVTTHHAGTSDALHDLKIQSDGKIVGSGSSYDGSRSYFALVRYNADGSLDSGFGTTGRETITVGSDDSSSSVALLGSDKILAAGSSGNGSYDDFALARLKANGALDDLSGYACVSAPVTDPDSNAASSLVDVHVCSTNSFSNGACAGTELCSVKGARSGDSAQCVISNQVPIPTAHGDASAYPAYVFTVDSNGLQGTGSSVSGYAVTDMPPSIATYAVNDISPTAGGSVNASFSVLVSDDNGWDDIDTVDGLIYDSNATTLSSGTCAANEKNCYLHPSCSKVQSSSTQVTATCDGIVTWFNIDPTSPGVWKAHANAFDSSHTVVGADSATDISVGSLSAVAVAETSLAYGGIPVGGTSPTSLPTTLANVGNIPIDIGIHGTDMVAGSNSIPAAQQHWAVSSDFSWGASDHALVNSETVPGSADQGCANESVAVRAAHGSVSTDKNAYWKLRIPNPQPTGSYSGSNTFTSIVDGLCTGSDGNAPASVCGNGVTENGEACDDGNTNDGDGCSSSCQVESGYSCTGVPSVCTLTGGGAVCGNGVIETGEACDDGSNNGTPNHCNSTCSGTTSSVCGNGVIETGEACDDHNTNNGDGCSNSCAVESGYACTGSPSVCTHTGGGAVCGNGIIEAGETCDDHNTNNGDGCSSACTIEPFHTCTGTPSVCIGLIVNMGGEPFAIALQSDGKTVQVGSGVGNDFALVRYNADGTLDTSFGTGGKAFTDFGVNSEATSVAIYGSGANAGKIVVGGDEEVSMNNPGFALARYNADGSLDTGFGSDGTVTTAFWGHSDQIHSVAIDGNGKIVVAGSATISGSNDNFELVRYNADGSLDTSFGTGGKVSTVFAYGSSWDPSIAIQSDGKIVAAGETYNYTNANIALARYNANGTLDTTFGPSLNGKVNTFFSDPSNYWSNGYDVAAEAVAIDGSGNIVVGGYAADNYASDFALARYTPSGALDASFGSGGKVTTDLGSSNDMVYSIAIQGDGKIVAVGYTENGGGDERYGLARYNTNGSLDTGFGSGGKVVFNITGSSQGYANSVAIRSDGKILVGGDVNSSAGTYALTLFNGDGSY
jgi:uncharacterized delta-60 repeat protein